MHCIDFVWDGGFIQSFQQTEILQKEIDKRKGGHFIH